MALARLPACRVSPRPQLIGGESGAHTEAAGALAGGEKLSWATRFPANGSRNSDAFPRATNVGRTGGCFCFLAFGRRFGLANLAIPPAYPMPFSLPCIFTPDSPTSFYW